MENPCRTRASVRSRPTSRPRHTAVAALALSTALTSAAFAAAPTVQTSSGPVQGFVPQPGLAEFLGIPYAAPPVGKLRWTPPTAPAPWTKPLQATAYGPTCAQITELGVFAGPANNNEACLYLNVFTPDARPDAHLPVLMWIHGGGNVDGESNDYDGSKLALQGHAVVVTINYRLGLLGFLANPALDAEGHPFANYGLLDQQFAMQWIQKNIRAFGGDPAKVAVGGQSAGSVDTSAQVGSPLAKGLFDRAIFESILVDTTPLATAEATGAAFSAAAGCGSGNTPAVAACLRRLTTQQIMALEGTPSQSSQYVTNIIADGTILPAGGLFNAFRAGDFNHMPIMSGTVHDEYDFVLAINEYFSHPRTPPTYAEVRQFIENSFGDNAGKVLAQYHLRGYQTAQLAWDSLGTAELVCPQFEINKVLARQVPLYAYEFNDQNIPSYFPKMPGYQPLAYHTGDIQFLFPLWHGGPKGIAHPLNAAQETLSDELVSAWTDFAASGDPNGEGNAPWPRYQPGGNGQAGYYLSENVPELTVMSAADYNAEHKCSFWSHLQND